MKYYFNLPQTKEDDAPFLKRTSAFLIDIIIFYLLLYTPFIVVFQKVSGINNNLLNETYLLNHPFIIGALSSAIISSSFIFCFYLSIMEYLLGATIGEYFTKLKITPSSLWKIIARNITKSTLIILLPFDLIGMFLFKQKLIDTLLGIKVLYERRLNLTYD